MKNENLLPTAVPAAIRRKKHGKLRIFRGGLTFAGEEKIKNYRNKIRPLASVIEE